MDKINKGLLAMPGCAAALFIGLLLLVYMVAVGWIESGGTWPW